MNRSNNPLELFRELYKEHLDISNEKIPSACCLSTNGLDGFPNSRFVSLKEVTDHSFIITGPLNSRKGKEIEKSQKVALAFWWPESKRQVRIQGTANFISDAEADKYFRIRSRDSQLVSKISEQGKKLESISLLQEKFGKEMKFRSNDITRPEYWGGIAITPLRIEFMKFNRSRLHERTLFEFIESSWTTKLLQP